MKKLLITLVLAVSSLTLSAQGFSRNVSVDIIERTRSQVHFRLNNTNGQYYFSYKNMRFTHLQEYEGLLMDTVGFLEFVGAISQLYLEKDKELRYESKTLTSNSYELKYDTYMGFKCIYISSYDGVASYNYIDKRTMKKLIEEKDRIVNSLNN